MLEVKKKKRFPIVEPCLVNKLLPLFFNRFMSYYYDALKLKALVHEPRPPKVIFVAPP